MSKNPIFNNNVMISDLKCTLGYGGAKCRVEDAPKCTLTPKNFEISYICNGSKFHYIIIYKSTHLTV